jgi:hypothetical protein
MRFRVHGAALHVHRCPEHPDGCDYFADHALPWMLGNRSAARDQLLSYRASLVARISVLTGMLRSVDALLGRLELLGKTSS